MNQEITEGRPERKILSKVYKGMEVYDVEGDKVGTVERVFLGAVGQESENRAQGPRTAPVPDPTKDESFVEDLSDVFDPEDKIPDVVRERLLRHGFIRVEGAELFDQDQYVIPEQIAAIDEDGVKLRIVRDELYED